MISRALLALCFVCLSGCADAIGAVQSYPTRSQSTPATVAGADTGWQSYLKPLAYFPLSAGLTSHAKSRFSLTLVAAGDAAVTSNDAKFGSSSAEFDGTGDTLEVTAFEEVCDAIGSGSYGYGYWAKADATSAGVDVILQFGASNNDSHKTWIDGSTSDKLSAYWQSLFTGGAGQEIEESTATGTGVWAWLYVGYEYGTSSFYVDGTRVGTTSHTTPSDYADNLTSCTLWIGSGDGGTNPFTGHIQDLIFFDYDIAEGAASLDVPTETWADILSL